jgi:hypothetical protein
MFGSPLLAGMYGGPKTENPQCVCPCGWCTGDRHTNCKLDCEPVESVMTQSDIDRIRW